MKTHQAGVLDCEIHQSINASNFVNKLTRLYVCLVLYTTKRDKCTVGLGSRVKLN